jgi:cell division septal protein FtsQ
VKAVAEKSLESPGRSWRTIRQEVSSPAMSRRGHRRRLAAWIKVGTLTLLLGVGAWGGYTVFHSWSTDRAALASAVHSEPVKEIVVLTDGVLNQKWATGVLKVPKGASLMALDLPALREKLTAYGQVRLAVLTRSFPDTLVVTLQERTPVARLQASEGLGQMRQLMVAKDGTVYEGVGYDRPLVASLPWLDGVRLVRAKTGPGFAPLEGMEDVSALLTTAQLQAPHLYRTWMVVSLERLAVADEIMVKAQDVPRIVFSRKRDYFKQVAQLDYVIDASHVLPEPNLQSVNLTYEGQVPVRLQGTPEELVNAIHPEFPLQPPSRKTKRDL